MYPKCVPLACLIATLDNDLVYRQRFGAHMLLQAVPLLFMTADMNLCHFLADNEIGYIRKQRYKKTCKSSGTAIKSRLFSGYFQ